MKKARYVLIAIALMIPGYALASHYLHKSGCPSCPSCPDSDR